MNILISFASFQQGLQSEKVAGTKKKVNLLAKLSIQNIFNHCIHVRIVQRELYSVSYQLIVASNGKGRHTRFIKQSSSPSIFVNAWSSWGWVCVIVRTWRESCECYLHKSRVSKRKIVRVSGFYNFRCLRVGNWWEFAETSTSRDHSHKHSPRAQNCLRIRRNFWHAKNLLATARTNFELEKKCA